MKLKVHKINNYYKQNLSQFIYKLLLYKLTFYSIKFQTEKLCLSRSLPVVTITSVEMCTLHGVMHTLIAAVSNRMRIVMGVGCGRGRTYVRPRVICACRDICIYMCVCMCCCFKHGRTNETHGKFRCCCLTCDDESLSL